MLKFAQCIARRFLQKYCWKVSHTFATLQIIVPPLMTNIAITGGIASGKSLLGEMLSQLGADVLDVDEIVRSMHRSGGEGAKMVNSVFGVAYLTEDGSTDRAKLGDFIFKNPAARRQLDALLHPLVRRVALAWRDAASNAPFKAALIPLLFESGWRSDWNVALTIESPLESRLARLAARGLSQEAAQARIAAQLAPERRRELADIIISNDGGFADLSKAANFIFKYMENH